MSEDSLEAGVSLSPLRLDVNLAFLYMIRNL